MNADDEFSIQPDAQAPPPAGGAGAPTEPPKLGFVPSLIGVHTAPAKTFASIGAHPGTWWIAVLVLMAASAVVLWLTIDRIQTPMIIEQMERSGTPAEDIEQALPAIRIATWGSLILVPIVILAIAAVLNLVFSSALGGAGRFVQALAITSFGLLIGILESLIKVPLLLAKGDVHVYLGPAALLPVDPESFLFKLLAQFDVFTLWKVAVIAIGFAVVYRIAQQKALVVVGGLWLLWVLGTTILGHVVGGGAT